MKYRCFIFHLAIVFGFISTTLAAQVTKPLTDPAVVFEKDFFQTVGISRKGLPRYKALRRAQSLARSNLENSLKSLRISGNTTIENEMNASLEFKKCMEAFFGGISKCGQAYDEENQRADVCMQVKAKGEGGVFDCLLPRIQEIDFLQPTGSDEPFSVEKNVSVGEMIDTEVPNPAQPFLFHDGLIVDTRDFSFYPALINRVLSDRGDVVFSPTEVPAGLLVESGCRIFATDETRARGILENRGCVAPLLVSCTGVWNHTDATISQGDAELIDEHNQKSSLLSRANIVFIVNRKR